MLLLLLLWLYQAHNVRVIYNCCSSVFENQDHSRNWPVDEKKCGKKLFIESFNLKYVDSKYQKTSWYCLHFSCKKRCKELPKQMIILTRYKVFRGEFINCNSKTFAHNSMLLEINTYNNHGNCRTNRTSGQNVWPMMFVVGNAAHAREPCHH